MGEILVTPDQLCQTADSIRTHARLIQRAMVTVDHEVHRNIDGKFEGNRAEYFFQQYRNQREKLMYAPHKLMDFAAKLDEIAARFREADDALQGKRYGLVPGMTAGGQPIPYSSRAHVTEIPPRDYAIFSSLSYSDNPDLPQELKDLGWEYLGSAQDFGAARDGYSGAAFINPRTGEVVIAHRGSQEWDINPFNDKVSDLDDDLQLWLGKRPPDQFQYSRQFIEAVNERLSLDGRIEGYTVVHTGHSLGAVLADLNALTDGTKGITFDNPGSLQIVANDLDKFPDEGRSNLINYQSNPNVVHWGGNSAGYTVQIIPAEGSTWSGPLAPLNYLETASHHSLDNIVGSISPETGFPKGYFPPGAGDVNMGSHSLRQFQTEGIFGAAGAPACYNPPPLPPAN